MPVTDERFFEFTSPFYAMIRAKDEKEAIAVYHKEVLHEYEDTIACPIKEIPIEKALYKFVCCTVADEDYYDYTLLELKNDFVNPHKKVLLVSGELV